MVQLAKVAYEAYSNHMEGTGQLMLQWNDLPFRVEPPLHNHEYSK